MTAMWEKERSMKSLHVLARKFVELMAENENGVINLHEVRIRGGCDLRRIKYALANPLCALQAGERLDVKQKRRIYDITNVLEGIGLIHKLSKNTVQWR